MITHPSSITNCSNAITPNQKIHFNTVVVTHSIPDHPPSHRRQLVTPMPQPGDQLHQFSTRFLPLQRNKKKPNTTHSLPSPSCFNPNQRYRGKKSLRTMAKPRRRATKRKLARRAGEREEELMKERLRLAAAAAPLPRPYKSRLIVRRHSIRLQSAALQPSAPSSTAAS